MEELYTVYALADRNTYLIYYVGQSSDYIYRFQQHLTRGIVQELISQGIDLCPYPLQENLSLQKALMFERRWIFHALQTRQPLINAEANNTLFVQYLQRNPQIDFLNLPENIGLYIPGNSSVYRSGIVKLTYVIPEKFPLETCNECMNLHRLMQVAAKRMLEILSYLHTHL
jgi:hypothetical protein